MIRIERRLEQPRWLSVAVPVVSLVVAFLAGAIVLAATGHDPVDTYRKLVDSAFFAPGAIEQTLDRATPLLFTGLAAAVAFRIQLFNIGAEGQLLLGTVGASGVGAPPRRHRARPCRSSRWCSPAPRSGSPGR